MKLVYKKIVKQIKRYMANIFNIKGPVVIAINPLLLDLITQSKTVKPVLKLVDVFYVNPYQHYLNMFDYFV